MPYARLIYITYQLVKNTQEKTQEKKSLGGSLTLTIFM